jgi:hypothetical protein
MSDPMATVLSTIFATSVSTFFSWMFSVFSTQADRRRHLSDQLIKLIELSITYPTLENQKRCEQWPNYAGTEDDLIRYDSYCCFVFNLMEEIQEFCGGNRQKMRELFHAEEMIWRHRKWWAAEVENKKGYRVAFRDFVNSTIAKKNKEMNGDS